MAIAETVTVPAGTFDGTTSVPGVVKFTVTVGRGAWLVNGMGDGYASCAFDASVTANGVVVVSRGAQGALVKVQGASASIPFRCTNPLNQAQGTVFATPYDLQDNVG